MNASLSGSPKKYYIALSFNDLRRKAKLILAYNCEHLENEKKNNEELLHAVGLERINPYTPKYKFFM